MSLILTEENYFSPEAEQFYMGSTQFKRFMECEAQAMAHIRGDIKEEPSTAMLVGSYVDAYFSGKLNLFKTKNPNILKKDGTLKADYLQANENIRRIERDEMFLQALSGKTQVIMTGVIEGVPVKIKIDSLLPGRTVDLKVMRDMADKYIDGEFAPFWKAWRYDIQGAIYQEIRRQKDNQRKPFGLAVITKEKPEPDLALLEFSQSVLSTALDEVKSSIAYYDLIKQGQIEPQSCGTCAWCRQNKTLKRWEIIN